MKNIKKYIIPVFIVIVILLLIYAIKGIYPFGNLTIANGDLGQSYMPSYYFMYDVLHGSKIIFYEYDLGMGSNIFGGIINGGLLNPLNYIIVLNSRENIPYMFSFVLIIKMVCIAISSYYLFNKLFKNNNFYNTIFSVLYAFSGYSLMYNTNINWLDVVALFPLFILAIKHMFETNKIYWYVIILTLILLMSYNLAYMVLLFIIFIVPIYIIVVLDKEERYKATFNLMLGTLLAGMLSAFAVLPALMQTLSSYRIASLDSFNSNSNIFFKIVMFFIYSLPAYGFIKWISKCKDDKKYIITALFGLIFSALLPIIFEPINKMWHGGSYQCFPFRYGFIPLMILYLGSLRFFSNYKKGEKVSQLDSLNILISIIMSIALITLSAMIAFLININNPAFNMGQNLFTLIFIVFYLGLMILFSAYKINNKKVKTTFILLVVIFQILTYAFAYVGVYKESSVGIEWSDDGLFASNEIYAKFKNNNTLYRLKDLSFNTTENDSLVYDVPSMSTFLHIAPKEQILNCAQIGYSNRKTQLNDYGGTLFSDAIYGVKYVLSYNDLSSELYNYVDTILNDVKIYEYKYSLPNVILYDNYIEKIPEELNNYDAQNFIYKVLFNKEDNIIELVDNIDYQNELNHYSLTFSLDKSKELYLNIDDLDQQVFGITINGKLINIPLLNDKENITYPSRYCNGILDLGYYSEGQSIKLEFDYNEKFDINSFKLGALDIEKYKELINTNQNNIQINIYQNRIIIEGNVDHNQKLFIPITYDTGWRVISGNTIINRVLNIFTSIDLKQGYNKIELEFIPPYFSIGLMISLLTIVFMFLMYLFEKRWNIRNVNWIMFICFIIAIIVYFIALCIIYIMPLISL